MSPEPHDTIRGLVPLTKRGFDAGRPTPYGFDRAVIDASGREVYRIRDLGRGVCHQIFPDGQAQVYENGARPAKDKTTHSKLVAGAPERIEVVRRIFDSYARHEKGMRTIIEELNDEGIPGPRGGPWGMGTIRNILINPVYYGANVWNVRSFSKYHRIEGGVPVEAEDNGGFRFNDPGDWIVADPENNFESLIPKSLFERAQSRRTSRNRPHSRGKAVVAPYLLSGLLYCTCGHHLQGQTKTSGKRKGYRKYYYYVCGGFQMKGKTVCRQYHVPKDAIETFVFDALVKYYRQLGRVENLRAQIMELLRESGPPRDGQVPRLESLLKQTDRRIHNWQSAIENGVDIVLAAENLNRLKKERDEIARELESARAAENLNTDLDAVSQEILAGLDRLQEILEKGTVAEVKAALRAYIGRIEYNPENSEARVGFLRIPSRASASIFAQETARISFIAGAGSVADSSSCYHVVTGHVPTRSPPLIKQQNRVG